MAISFEQDPNSFFQIVFPTVVYYIPQHNACLPKAILEICQPRHQRDVIYCLDGCTMKKEEGARMKGGGGMKRYSVSSKILSHSLASSFVRCLRAPPSTSRPDY